MELRPGVAAEEELYYQCIEDARSYHASMGFEQWHPDYPSRQTIRDDIATGTGYKFEEDGTVVGYCCITSEEEPAYRVIDGAWKTDRPYLVIHRMAFLSSARGSGRSEEAFRLIRAFCASNGILAIRVDTQEENKVMQHILARQGFAYCGTVQFDGGPKLAYEWDA